MQVQFNRLVPVSFLIIVVFGVAAAAVAKTSSVVVPASLGVLFLALSGLAMLMRASANGNRHSGAADCRTGVHCPQVGLIRLEKSMVCSFWLIPWRDSSNRNPDISICSAWVGML